MKKNKILVIIPKEKGLLQEYQAILSHEISSSLISDIPEFLFSDSANDVELASQCNIWFGTPSLIAPLLSFMHEERQKHPGNNKIILPEWVQSVWAGVEPFMMEGMPRMGEYRLTNMRGIFNGLIAEYAVGHIMSHALNVREHLESNKQKQWNQIPPRPIRGKTVGVLGVGEIGSAVAKLCKLLGMRVYGYTRTSEDCEDVDRYFHASSPSSSQVALQDMAPDIDYWVNLLPNTPLTVDTLNKQVFDCMKTGTVLINAGRGNSIVDIDLLSALDSNLVDAAILDVFRQEPLLPSSEFWTHPKVLVTSHTAAPTKAIDAVFVFLDNYRLFCTGKPLKYQVDFERGY